MTIWMDELLRTAYNVTRDTPPHARVMATLAYLDQTAHKVPHDEAVDFVNRLVQNAAVNDTVLSDASGGTLIPYPDPNAAFGSKQEYLPLLRMAAKELRNDHGIYVERGIHGGVLWINYTDRLHDGRIENFADEILTIVNGIFLKYNLGSVGTTVQDPHHWDYERKVADNITQITGEPYPGAREDCEAFLI